MGKKIVSVVIMVAAIGIIGFLVSGLEGKASTDPGAQAINFTLKDIDGNTYQLSDFKGQTVVLNFFATWCQPCIDEAPELEAFGRDYQDAQLIILARGESQKRMEKYIEETGSKLLYLLDTKADVSDDYSVIGQPETLIINGNGVIVERFSGPTTKDKLIELIKEKA
jgi:cytochrome c biogenesis protein CcmG, thiol:disulfide interchange protein DsbE